MAKITITVEDMPNGTVKIVADPTVETMIAMEMSGQKMTAAHGYAVKALNEVRKSAQEQGSILKVPIPRLGI